jgi:hypothetical protein
MNEYIEKEMYNTRKEAMKKLSSIVTHPKCIDDFALTLAYSWFDSQKSAENIANEFDLDKLDFLAIQEAFEAFKELYIKEQESYQTF